MLIRLLIADDHAIIRDGLRMMFDGTEVQIVAEAANGNQAAEALQQQPVDVAVVDINMPGGDGFHFLHLARELESRVPVLMHSVNDSREHLRRSRELGARGFVLKGQEPRVLLAAVRTVHQGQEFWALTQTPT